MIEKNIYYLKNSYIKILIYHMNWVYMLKSEEKKTNVTKKILHNTINYRIVYFETKLRFLNYL